jgi:hypothetical protein
MVEYDVEEHMRRKKWMLGCFAVMVCFWGLAWWISVWAAVCSIVANLYFCFGMYFAFRLYPDRVEDYEITRRAHARPT